MKTDIHPTNYRPVVFQDLNNETTFLVRSTAPSDETITLDGVEYPLIKVHISSSSHPFYTGQEKLVDVEGRVDRFKARQDAATKKKEALASKAKKAKKKSETEVETEVSKVGDGTKVKPKADKPVAKAAKTASDSTEDK